MRGKIDAEGYRIVVFWSPLTIVKICRLAA